MPVPSGFPVSFPSDLPLYPGKITQAPKNLNKLWQQDNYRLDIQTSDSDDKVNYFFEPHKTSTDWEFINSKDSYLIACQPLKEEESVIAPVCITKINPGQQSSAVVTFTRNERGTTIHYRVESIVFEH